MKLGRFSAMAAAAVMVAGALIGATGAGKASASYTSPTRLCVDSSSQGNRCIQEPNALGASALLSALASGENEQWLYPGTGSTGEIVSYQATCLQVNAAGGYTVRNASCVNDAAEQWINEYDASAGRTVFVSVYDPNLCLSADYIDGIVKADSCANGISWYQEWGTS
jgi:hypothetical protein